MREKIETTGKHSTEESSTRTSLQAPNFNLNQGQSAQFKSSHSHSASMIVEASPKFTSATHQNLKDFFLRKDDEMPI